MLFKTDEKARSQHDAIRNNVGWYRWTHDLVEVSGKNAGELLDYLCVNSIAKAAVGRSKYTTLLDEDGGIIDDVIVMHMKEDLYWVSTLYAPKFMIWVDTHKKDLAVDYKDLTYEIDMYAVQGPNSLDMLNAMLSNPVNDLKRFQVEKNEINGISVEIHRSGFTGELGFEIFCDMANSKEIQAALRETGKAFKAVEMDILEVYIRSLPMEKGFALRQDMFGLTPYEAGLGWSVDLDKDFIGKEPTKKASEGEMNQKLVGLEFECESYEDISQGERVLLRGLDIGLVRACIYGYTIDKNIGFAVIDAKYAIPGTRVEIGCNNSPAVICEKQWI